MKITLLLSMAVLFLGLLLPGIWASQHSEEIDYPVEQSKEFTGHFDKEAERGINTLSFSPFLLQDLNKYSCDFSKKGPVYKVKYGKVVDPLLKPGAQCNAGQYIDYFECTDKTCSKKIPLFEHLWYKGDSNDLINFGSYWTVGKGEFWGSSTCYDCTVQGEPQMTYTCYNDVWRGEPGTKYGSLTGACESGCKEKGMTDKATDIALVKSKLCANSKKVVKSPSMPISKPTVPATPAPIIVEPSKLSGSWSNVRVPETSLLSQEYVIKAVFTASSGGRYYLESGTTPTQLAIVTKPGSLCDGDKHWSGEYVDLTPNESVEMEFHLLGREESGRYEAVIGAYSGCLSSGGVVVSKESSIIQFTSVTEEVADTIITPLKKIGLTTPMILIGIGLLLFVMLRKKR